MREDSGIQTRDLPVSNMAESLVGSEIIKLAGQIKERVAAGAKIHNLTIGDFNPEIFPIPTELLSEIHKAYDAGATNYPPANGLPELRKAVSKHISTQQGLEYSAENVLIAGGARPLIYATYTALMDPGDRCVFPTPSWNNNHYTHLTRGQQQSLETFPEDHFMPTAERIAPLLKGARLLSLCSPLNPTGTCFSEDQLRDICESVLAENARRGPDEKPLYVLYDQIYSMLTHGETKHVDPVSLFPEMAAYTVFIDGISKCFAATGVRVGWAFGPSKVIAKMKSILGHVGAWSPKAEQLATANFLNNTSAVDTFMVDIKQRIFYRLQSLYEGINVLKSKGYPVDVVAPQAAIYLTVRFDLRGKRKPDGTLIENTQDITAYLLEDAQLAIVPFYAFGADRDSTWYRVSIGTLKEEQIPVLLSGLESALAALS